MIICWFKVKESCPSVGLGYAFILAQDEFLSNPPQWSSCKQDEDWSQVFIYADPCYVRKLVATTNTDPGTLR